MVDRNVQHPTRYRMIKVPGTDDIFDMIPAPGTVYNEGTLINKANLLTDAVTNLIGLTGDVVPNDMFNVLATVGDLHVWRRTQTVGSGGYKLVNAGQQLITGTLQSADQSQTINYSDSITVTEESISLSGSVSSVDVSYNSYENANVLKGKFFQNPSAGNIIYYAPEDTVFNRASNPGPTYNVYATSLSTPEYVPPGTYTDYPVSVNPNAYQEGSDAKPAGYVLGEVIQKDIVLCGIGNLTSAESYMYGAKISVNEDGTINNDSLADYINIEYSSSGAETAQSALPGKFCIRTYKNTNADFPINEVVYIPEDAVFTFGEASSGIYGVYVDKYQTVTGYPAIPAGTTIEYLGKLGDKSRMQIVSYVGTGTYGASNPCSITADFPIKSAELVCLKIGSNNYLANPDGPLTKLVTSPMQVSYTVGQGFTTGTSATSYGKLSVDKKTISWYSTQSSTQQMNESGYTYYFRCEE